MKFPVCTIRNITCTKMEILNIYMKSAHDESDNLRIIRLTNSFEAAIKQEPIEKIDV